ncbi:restriction endonuclease [Amycolatopsis sp. lyj-84]|uniref:restriction endonuclease n=1 Tax=Amycolatopsis sp. lyj-84 TaxID=2789284 RepID=UPI003978003B
MGALIVAGALVSLLSFIGRTIAAHPVLSMFVIVTVISVTVYLLVLRHRTRARDAQERWELEVVRSQEIARYHAMGATEFEQALAFLCSRDGCSNAGATGRAGDLGADVVAYTPDGRKIVLQAKRYISTNKVTGPDLQRFGGTCFSVHRAGVAAVVTTSTFTKQAREYAGQMGIRLFDAHALAAWASRTGPAPWH